MRARKLGIAALTSVMMAAAFTGGVNAASNLDCLPRSAVKCSTGWANVAVPLIAAFSEIFEEACVKHDFCYRFGATTYGYSRKHCDNEFRDKMHDICQPDSVKEILFTVGSLGASVAGCSAMAEAYYGAVWALGKSGFATKKQGKHCAYDGPVVRDHRTKAGSDVKDHRKKGTVRDHRTN